MTVDSYSFSLLCVLTCVLSCFSRVQLFATLWTVACWAPLSMGFSRQEFWSGCCALFQGPSRPRDWTWVSCITGGFFTAEPQGKPWSSMIHGQLPRFIITCHDSMEGEIPWKVGKDKASTGRRAKWAYQHCSSQNMSVMVWQLLL